MLSATVRFTEVSSPAVNVAPLLSRVPPPSHSSTFGPPDSAPLVAVALSGHSLAVFNVRDVKRVAVWALHPKTVFASNPVIHHAKLRIFAPIKAHIDLPRSASSRTIWSWTCDSDINHRDELSMDDTIFSVFAPASVPNHLIVVHHNAKISLVSHSLKSTETHSLQLDLPEPPKPKPAPAPASKKGKKSGGAAAAAAAKATAATPFEPTVLFAKDFAANGTLYLLLLVSTPEKHQPLAVLCTITAAGALDLVYAHPLPNPTSCKDSPFQFSLHAPSRHLVLFSESVPLQCAALDNKFIALLHVLSKAPSGEKSRYSVSLYSAAFGTVQGSTTFDADLIATIAPPEPKLGQPQRALTNDLVSELIAVDDHVIASLSSCHSKRGPSKAVLLRCTVESRPVSLLSVLGRNRASSPTDLVSSANVSLRAMLPQSDDVTQWTASLTSARDAEAQLLSNLASANSPAALEATLFNWLKKQARGQIVLHAMFDPAPRATPVFSRRVLEYLLKHNHVSHALMPVVLDAKRNLVEQQVSAPVLELTLKRVADVPEDELVKLVLVLCRAIAAQDGASKLFGDQDMDNQAAKRVLVRALAYPHTDVFVHSAMAKLDAVDAHLVLTVLTQMLVADDTDKAIVVPWLNHLLDAHLTTLLVAGASSSAAGAPPADQAGSSLVNAVHALQAALKPQAKAVAGVQDTVGVLTWFLQQVRQQQERQAVGKFVGLDGRVREQRQITQKERYQVEVVHF
ncbi:hypothetical protein BCR44DRAFT_1424237 [Catenaria anguillulae PL171]|uniref:Uncharacterized protein n=1 Tax=Catenaria anguillulae PL171 TaxID=765915 RepID=A0A1Y2I4R7_9FUNG|nr:hypothetical protein BCR44DRAFT_1424237 [Catenaria anguillulae PL171]